MNDMKINLYCAECKKKQTNYDNRFPLHIPHLKEDKENWEETIVECHGCGGNKFIAKAVIENE